MDGRATACLEQSIVLVDRPKKNNPRHSFKKKEERVTG